VGVEGSDLTGLKLSMERTSTFRQPPHLASRPTRWATSMALPVCDAYNMMRRPFATGGDDGGAMKRWDLERDKWRVSYACSMLS
jgi:hypothetical protein